jgi:hypothetical protein
VIADDLEAVLRKNQKSSIGTKALSLATALAASALMGLSTS